MSQNPSLLEPAHTASEKEGALRQTLAEIAQFIREDTGWKLNLSKMKVEEVSRQEYFRKMGQELADATQIDPKEVRDAHRRNPLLTGLLLPVRTVRQVAESLEWKMVQRKFVAGFAVESNSILLIRGSTPKNDPGSFNNTLYHELTHAAQQQTFPGFQRELYRLYREYQKALTTQGSQSPEAKDILDTINARMTLVEGHATVLPYLTKHFEESTPRRNIKSLLETIAMKVVSPRGNAKVKQYTEGLKGVVQILKQENGPQLLDEAYRDPKLADVLFKTRGEVHFHFSAKPGLTLNDDLLALRGKIALFQAANPSKEGRPKVKIFLRKAEGATPATNE